MHSSKLRRVDTGRHTIPFVESNDAQFAEVTESHVSSWPQLRLPLPALELEPLEVYLSARPEKAGLNGSLLCRGPAVEQVRRQNT
jgi:hypothetical protein